MTGEGPDIREATAGPLLFFFFYGTLVEGLGNPLAGLVHRKLAVGIPAVVRGRLHAIEDERGWYPALLPDEAESVVRGFVHIATDAFGAEDLALLDAYEGCDPDKPEASDYQRRIVAVRLEDGGLRNAQAYVWARGLPEGAVPIPGGDFVAFLSEMGLVPYTE